MAASRAEDVVEAAIRGIEKAVVQGRRIREAFQKESGRHDREFLAALAKRHRLTPSAVLRRRLLADPDRGFDEEELEEIYAAMREAVRPIGPTLLDAAIAVPRDRRRELLREAIRGGWSSRRLRQAAAAATGRKFSFAGRRPHVPEDPAAVLLSLHGLCLEWGHWMSEARRETGRDGVPRTPPIESLRESGVQVGRRGIVRVVQQVEKTLRELREAIEAVEGLRRA